mmetsp:Transcript_4826/g.14612  ORF Transcript_4826/g.14612 Transcript_4826/m.14612 type:complete len:83 (-) Transcript_4826:894-1142(-)
MLLASLRRGEVNSCRSVERTWMCHSLLAARKVDHFGGVPYSLADCKQSRAVTFSMQATQTGNRAQATNMLLLSCALVCWSGS